MLAFDAVEGGCVSDGRGQNYSRWFVDYPSNHRLAGQTVEVTPVERLLNAEWDLGALRAERADAIAAAVMPYREALERYADHSNWRCGHPDRWPWNPDCPCGLVSTLSALGIDGEAF